MRPQQMSESFTNNRATLLLNNSLVEYVTVELATHVCVYIHIDIHTFVHVVNVKMAAKCRDTQLTSSNFYENNHVSLSSECQCCSSLRSEMCYLINELKSMTEIINILKEEVKYDCAVNQDQRTYSACVKKTLIRSQCDNYPKFENQLKLKRNLNVVKQTTPEDATEEAKLVKQTSHNLNAVKQTSPEDSTEETKLVKQTSYNLNAVKQTTPENPLKETKLVKQTSHNLNAVKQTTLEDLMEKTKLVKQTSHNLNAVKQTMFENPIEETKPMKLKLKLKHNINNTNNPWLTTRLNASYGHHSAHSAGETHEAPITYQYSVPTANQYTTLARYQELQHDRHPSRSTVDKNRKYATRSPHGKKLTTYLHRPTRIFPVNKPNLQE